VKKTLGLVAAVTAMFAVFGTGSALAVDEYKGQTYNDAASAISKAGSTPIIATKVGSFLPTGQCIVTGSHNADFLNSSGTNSGGKVLLSLNCNYMFALPGVPGNSLGSPEGKAAHDSAVQQAQQQQQQQQQQAQGSGG
jgi:hypothetical protein